MTDGMLGWVSSQNHVSYDMPVSNAGCCEVTILEYRQVHWQQPCLCHPLMVCGFAIQVSKPLRNLPFVTSFPTF